MTRLALWVLVAVALFVDAAKDYYKILGVPKNFNDRQLKKAYRTLALKYHPDKADEADRDAAQAKFLEVAEAYEVLSDPKKKEEYDLYGADGPNAGPQGGPQAGPQGGGRQFRGDPFEMFNQFFGGGGGRRGRGGHQEFQFSGMDGFGGFGGGGNPFGGGGSPFGGGRPQQQPPAPLYSKESGITRLTPKKFPGKSAKNEWLVQFYSAADKKCVKFKPAFEAVARDLRGRVKVGAVDCDKHKALCQKYQVASLPSFGYILDGAFTPYEGDLDEYLVYNFAFTKYAARLKARRDAGDVDELHSGNQAKLCGLGKEADPASAAAICAVFVLPSAPTAAQKALVKATAAKYKAQKGLHVVFVNAKDHTRLLNKLQAPATPTLLVVRARTKQVRVGVLAGAFDDAGVSATLERAIGGDLAMKSFPATTVDFK
ncbi:Type II (General) Secretory Pathway (IISP) Family [Achlya hypogyna]|uniref:Secreted protein n=1 Tax=Achlya hypogyna TaxID=1202772 RepID=A0A0A7CNL3_ACHHY|nr:secreted protein [Achlya hypogyna]OQR82586.1 Type II (General) Secretory Pathway (IISP) Family [Achlya hypogyna]